MDTGSKDGSGSKERKDVVQAQLLPTAPDRPSEKISSATARGLPQTLLAAWDDACNLALNVLILDPEPEPGRLAI